MIGPRLMWPRPFIDWRFTAAETCSLRTVRPAFAQRDADSGFSVLGEVRDGYRAVLRQQSSEGRAFAVVVEVDP